MTGTFGHEALVLNEQNSGVPWRACSFKRRNGCNITDLSPDLSDHDVRQERGSAGGDNSLEDVRPSSTPQRELDSLGRQFVERWRW